MNENCHLAYYYLHVLLTLYIACRNTNIGHKICVGIIRILLSIWRRYGLLVYALQVFSSGIALTLKILHGHARTGPCGAGVFFVGIVGWSVHVLKSGPGTDPCHLLKLEDNSRLLGHKLKMIAESCLCTHFSQKRHYI